MFPLFRFVQITFLCCRFGLSQVYDANQTLYAPQETKALFVFFGDKVKIPKEGMWGTITVFDDYGNKQEIEGNPLTSLNLVPGNDLENCRLFLFRVPREITTFICHFAPVSSEDAWINTTLAQIEQNAYVIDSSDYYWSDKTSYWSVIPLTLSQFVNYFVGRMVDGVDLFLSPYDFEIVESVFYSALPHHSIEDEKEIVWFGSDGGETNLYESWCKIEKQYKELVNNKKNTDFWMYLIGALLLLIAIGIPVLVFAYGRKKEKN